jgi:hypothetical protein
VRESDYRRRVTTDLARWVQAGWISPASADAIMADVRAGRSAFSAVGWLSMVAMSFAGLAVIALVAANWTRFDAGVKLGALLALFWVGIGLTAWAAHHRRPGPTNAAAAFAALVFAASVGLLGQAFNLSGQVGDAALLAGLGAGLISAAARAPAPGAVAFPLVWMWFTGLGLGGSAGASAVMTPVPQAVDGLALALVLAGIGLARLTDSRTLRHLAWLTVGGFSVYAVAKLTMVMGEGLFTDRLSAFGVLAVLWAGLGLLGRQMMVTGQRGGRTLYGYGAWYCLLALVLLGMVFGPAHRMALIPVGIAVSVLGGRDHHGWVTAAGLIVAILGASWLMLDLGIPLEVAGLVFAVTALAAGYAAWLLFRSGQRGGPSPVAGIPVETFPFGPEGPHLKAPPPPPGQPRGEAGR